MKEKFKKYTQFKNTLAVSRRLLKIAWEVDPVLFSIYFLVGMLPAIIPFVSSYVYKLIIDFVVESIRGNVFDYFPLYFLIFLGAVLYFIQQAVFSTQAYLEILFFTKLPIYLNQLILGKISTLDMEYFENSDFKNSLEKVRETSSFRPQALLNEIIYMAQSFLQVSIALVAIIHLNWLLIVIVLIAAVPEFVNRTIRSKVSWGIWNANSEIRKRYWYLSTLLQSVESVKEIKLFSLGKRFLKEIKTLQLKFYRENAQVAKTNYFYNVGFGSLSVFIFIGVQTYVVFQALSRKVTIGDIEFYRGVVNNFSNGLGGFFRNVNQILDHSLYVESIFEVLDAKPLLKEKSDAVILHGDKAPVIEFKNVSFSYPGSKKHILHNFSLIINPGEKVAFVGENGAGKSTLIRLLSRFYDVTAGEILIDKVNIKDLEVSSWYKKIGVLFQDFARYEHSVKDNIHFGDITKNSESISDASALSGADEFIEKLDAKYDQMLGKTFEKGEAISTGQWQKIALARAFFRNAPILVLDEPTASIDARAESEIFERVESLSKDKTVIIISHRFSTVRNADRIFVIDTGKIIETGNHKELMKLNGQYAKLFTLQAKGYQ